MRFFWGNPVRALAAALCLAVAGSALAQDGIRMLDGSLTYRERIALPQDALVVVEARDARGRIIGEATFATRGQQVPLVFEIGLPEGIEADLRAAIVLDGQPRWFASDISVAGETDTDSVGEIVLRRFIPMGFASTLRCGNRELRVGFFGDDAVLDVDGERRVLGPVPSASGARFEARGDAGTWLWSRSNRALVSLDGELLPECSVVPPDAPEPYTARGSSPDWSMAVQDGRLSLSVAEGATVETALPEARYEEGGFVYRSPEEDVEIRMTPGLCRDPSSGMPHPEQVSVTLGETRLTGCGGTPRALLTGAEWVVEDIDGGGIVDASRITLAFSEDGGLGGQASCNRYATGIEIGPDGFAAGPIAATQMMCAEALMDQERRFFAALAASGRLEIDESGALRLYDPSRADPAITARR